MALGGPIGIREFDSWVWGTGSHGVLGDVNGTVLVDVGVRERSMGEKGFLAGILVTGLLDQGNQAKTPYRVFLFMIRVTLGGPIGIREFDNWVWGTGSHGVLGEVNGTVSVDVGVRERSVGEKGFLAGILVTELLDQG
nr:hypothetical protein [Tanacetum cinerariifolium]